jgi:hypothetical protein
MMDDVDDAVRILFLPIFRVERVHFSHDSNELQS